VEIAKLQLSHQKNQQKMQDLQQKIHQQEIHQQKLFQNQKEVEEDSMAMQIKCKINPHLQV